MATFTNQASLSYNGVVTNSNIIIGELQEVLSATKNAMTDSYTAGSTVTYIVNIINSGTTALNGLTLTDNLGEYTFNLTPVTPLTYVAGSAQFYVNGVLQATPAVTAGPPLAITGLNIPAGANAMLVYEATVNEYAPLATGGTIVNQAVISGATITDVTVTETVTASDVADLSIVKTLCPTTVTENGQITYTFTIQNMGNTPALAVDNVVLTDTFNPILSALSATFNGAAWSSPTNYTYDTATGAFATVAGQITVPAATYTQDATTGAWTVTPGVSTLVVTGTV